MEAADLERDDIVLLGTSKALAAIEPSTLSRLSGRRVRHLAINATSALPVLEWLAARRDFVGTALVEITPRVEFQAGHPGHATALRFVEELREYRRSPARRIESWLVRGAQSRLACRSPGFHLVAPYRDREGAGVRRLESMKVEPTRFIRLEYADTPDPSGAEARAPDPGQPAPEAEREVVIRRLTRAADEILRRGGKVVFLALPSSGRTEEIERKHFPRKEFWDSLARASTAPAVHFEDEPALAGFVCADGEHLAYRDALRFTEALARFLRLARQ